jgi:hypothetical protein
MRRPHHDEQGIAMITAVLTALVGTLLMTAAADYSLHSLGTSSVDRKKVQTVDASEAGIDLATARLGSAPLPCSLSGSLGTTPVPSTYSVTIAYSDQSGTALTCSGATLPSTSSPASAVITSTGDWSRAGVAVYGKRTLQSGVVLAALPSAVAPYAIYAGSSLSLSNVTTIQGSTGGGDDANVYAGSGYSCGDSLTLGGNLYVQGSISLGNDCTITSDAYSTQDITTTNSVSIGHDAKSSQGNITLSTGTSVGHDAIAHGTNTGGSVLNPNGRISGANLVDPPLPHFINWSYDTNPNDPDPTTPWRADGYTSFITDNDCNPSLSTNVYKDIAHMSTATQATVIVTSCALSWPVGSFTSVTTNQNLAIFASGGFTTSGGVLFASASSSLHDLYLITPYSASIAPCTTPGISVSSQTQLGSSTKPLDVFLYTPCDLTFNSTFAVSGQLYSGSRIISTNPFDLVFAPLATPGATTSDPSISYAVTSLYKREVINP